ncbi:MAG TPA: L-histidine N(alpha)-methyltransferase [Casimicrobiaceae bacterium]|nr:L-histidine N(alpha)-methyltransferase [Casimicrobiaceae bacterium]
MCEYPVVQRLVRDSSAERRLLIAGLTGRDAAIAPKYFYDTLGCALFGAICELPEYYPTRTERAIFHEHRDAIARAIGRGTQFVDLGAGDCAKAKAWLPFLVPTRYIAVDFAGEEIAASLARITPEFPDVEMRGVVADFTDGLDLTRDLTPDPVTFFYPGSSIGNFTPGEALRFLQNLHLHCIGRQGSGLLVGVDSTKDGTRLVAAYDDAVGVTAAFNRNVLKNVNRLLGSDFDPAAFDHRASYDEQLARVQMHLVARSRQEVRLPGVTRTFERGERIHTENSYKYAPEAFARLLHDAGFRSVRRWQDARGDFSVYYAC